MSVRHAGSLLLPAVLLVSCTEDAPPIPTDAGVMLSGEHVSYALTPEIHKTIAELRREYAKYHDLDKAIADGWTFVGCVSDPVLGGMGDHYSLHPDEADVRGDGYVDLDEPPDFLVYAPKANGGYKLVALDYTIPYTAWTQPDPPELFGIPFRPNDGFGVWMFHIWLFDHNKAGIFTDFDPEVPQCP